MKTRLKKSQGKYRLQIIPSHQITWKSRDLAHLESLNMKKFTLKIWMFGIEVGEAFDQHRKQQVHHLGPTDAGFAQDRGSVKRV